MFSPSSLDLFGQLLGQVSLPATHPNLEEAAAQIVVARRELEAALIEVQKEQPPKTRVIPCGEVHSGQDVYHPEGHEVPA